MATFKKGESGNPGGRPKGLGDIREIARQHTDKALETLVKVLEKDDASPSARVSAANALLDRAWGRPAQTINANVDKWDGKIDQDTLGSASELLKLIKAKPAPNPENKRETAEPQAVSVAPEDPSVQDVTTH